MNESKGVWEFISDQEADWLQRKLGVDAHDEKEHAKSCLMVVGGMLPLCWSRAKGFMDLMYHKAEIGKGDRVLLLGEDLTASGHVAAVRNLIGEEGDLQVNDFLLDGLETFQSDVIERICRQYGDDYFDAVVFAQGFHHAPDRDDAAKEMVRVLKKGKKLVLAEMLLLSTFVLAEQDIHLWCIFEKAFLSKVFEAVAGRRLSYEQMKAMWIGDPETVIPEVFGRYLRDTEKFAWKGIVLVDGRK